MGKDVRCLIAEENKDHGILWRFSDYRLFLIVAGFCCIVSAFYFPCKSVYVYDTDASKLLEFFDSGIAGLDNIQDVVGVKMNGVQKFYFAVVSRFVLCLGIFVAYVFPVFMFRVGHRACYSVVASSCFVVAGFLISVYYLSFSDFYFIAPDVVAACCAYKVARSRVAWLSIGF